MVKINQYTEIDLKEIKLEDTTFCFSFPQEADNLTESISKTGLIQPPILHENRIVCGRRRILSCKKLGWKMIPVGIIEEKQAEIEIFKLNLEDNLSTRELNIIEKSIILNKFLNLWHVPQDKIIKEYLPMLNTPANIKYLEKYMWLEDFPDELKRMIIKRKVTLDTLNLARVPINQDSGTPPYLLSRGSTTGSRMISYISGLDPAVKPRDDTVCHFEIPYKNITKIKNEILHLLLSFGFGNNKISDILTLLRDISLRDNAPVESPFQSAEWLKVKNNPQMSLYQKGTWLRDFLFKKRCPMHTEFKDRVKSLITKLNLPENISIELDSLLTWEDDSINLRLKCKKKEDLEYSIKKLQSLSNSPKLYELLDMLTII